MAIAAADIKFKFSEKVSGAGNTAAGTPAGSLGKNISTTEITDNTLNNLFDDITGDENAASNIEYRCIFVHNAHATLTWTTVVMWLSAEVGGGATIEIAVDDLPDSAIAETADQADTIADEDTAPGAGVGVFTAPVTKATGIALGDIAPGYCRAIWVKRSAANTAALDADGVTIKVEGDTSA
ncbi:MAG: hypothetical protein MUP81_00240 [Dehalococcoidia bacterium]|nr:hypothetical protein [Dehalococcoidia bacterium]